MDLGFSLVKVTYVYRKIHQGKLEFIWAVPLVEDDSKGRVDNGETSQSKLDFFTFSTQI